MRESTLVVRALLYPTKAPTRIKRERTKPNFAVAVRELARKHVTRRQLWREYRRQHRDGLKYTTFCVQ